MNDEYTLLQIADADQGEENMQEEEQIDEKINTAKLILKVLRRPLYTFRACFYF